MSFQKCPVCGGSGTIPETQIDVNCFNGEKTCVTCNGTGIINSTTGMPPQSDLGKGDNSNFEKVASSDLYK